MSWSELGGMLTYLTYFFFLLNVKERNPAFFIDSDIASMFNELRESTNRCTVHPTSRKISFQFLSFPQISNAHVGHSWPLKTGVPKMPKDNKRNIVSGSGHILASSSISILSFLVIVICNGGSLYTRQGVGIVAIYVDSAAPFFHSNSLYDIRPFSPIDSWRESKCERINLSGNGFFSFLFSLGRKRREKRDNHESSFSHLLFPHMTVRWDYHFLSGIIAIITALRRRRQKVVRTWLQIGLSLFLSLIEIYRVGASSQTVRTCFEFVCTCVRACVRVSYVVQVFFGRTHMLHSLKFSALIFPSSLSPIPKRLDVISFCMPRKYIVACSDCLRGEEKEKRRV